MRYWHADNKSAAICCICAICVQFYIFGTLFLSFWFILIDK